MTNLILFGITTLVFTIIDLFWLGIVAKKLYWHYLGPLLRPSPYWPAAAAFYTLFIIGLIIFAVHPAIASKQSLDAIKLGALFGFFTYMTYDLTNWATLKNWPWQIVVIDIVWGSILCASVCGISAWIYLRLVPGT